MSVFYLSEADFLRAAVSISILLLPESRFFTSFYPFVFFTVANADLEGLKLEVDKPFELVVLSHEATIRCCYHWNKKAHFNWIVNIQNTSGTTIRVRLNDIGLYQCKLNHNTLQIFTHGTFLQVYKPLQKTLNLSESVKNSIITALAVLLLISVLIPGTMLLCKSKRLNELERKKEREEENIYEGLNLDKCNSAYHQTKRSNQQGQDVAGCGEGIQLEKP
uniref:CD79a molecule, immunoglobulin-associated alpha n=1 Tax=Cyprinus carpio carpio TaxID=630221 RepID=A0A9J8BTR9_CYPCA